MILEATLVVEGPSVQRHGAFPVNPDAPENLSTKRLLRPEEKGRNRSKAPHKPPLSAESPDKDPRKAGWRRGGCRGVGGERDSGRGEVFRE